jgi:hypothetical protein
MKTLFSLREGGLLVYILRTSVPKFDNVITLFFIEWD